MENWLEGAVGPQFMKLKFGGIVANYRVEDHCAAIKSHTDVESMPRERIKAEDSACTKSSVRFVLPVVQLR